MSDVQDNPPQRGNWFWIAIIAVLFAILVYWFFEPFGGVPVAEEPEATLPSDVFTTAPEGGVPVQLPETPMTNTPTETQSPPPTMAE